jgi:hypothetical protein
MYVCYVTYPSLPHGQSKLPHPHHLDMHCDTPLFMLLVEPKFGPLHIRPKSHDHGIRRAQKKVCKGHRPKTLSNSCSVVMDPLECSVKSYVTKPSTKCCFNEFLFMHVLKCDNNRIIQRFGVFGVPWSPGFVSGLLPRGGFGNSPSEHET